MNGEYAQLIAYKNNGVTLKSDMQLPLNALKRMTKKSCLDDCLTDDEVVNSLSLSNLNLRLPLISPSTKTVKRLISKNKKINQEINDICFQKRKRHEDNDEIVEERKISKLSYETQAKIIRNNKLIAHRGISPCTEAELSCFKSYDKCMKESKAK